jgi:F-type H+-transporting ATPase subunit gamma
MRTRANNMANTQAIRRRITSTKNTRQITKAMELVSASKMRRAQESALKTRAYRNTARQILKRLEKLNTAGNVSSSSPLFDERPVSQRLYIVITSDRGLAGAYNNNVIRLFNSQLQRDEKRKNFFKCDCNW